MPRRLSLVLLGCALSAGPACEEEAPLPVFRVTFSADSDGSPIAAVRVVADGMRLGQTNEKGRLEVTLQGQDGSSLEVTALCPEGYREPEPLPLLRLRRFEGLSEATADRGIRMSISCPPATRHAAVVVRTHGHANIPVKVRGREHARTDAGGVAHLLFELAPNTTFRVELDTTDFPDLQPQNPGATFTLGDRDEIFPFEQEFEEKKPQRRRRRARPKPKGPQLPVRL